MKIIIFIFMSFVFSSEIHNILNSESSIIWTGTKTTGSHDGTILVKNGYVEIDKNSLLSGQINIDMNSIICTDIKNVSTNKYFVDHLKNEDFFSVEKFPIASLNILSSKLIKNNEYEITANLTIKDITQKINFVANIDINNNVATAKGKLEIDRSKFNIKYKSKTWFPDIGNYFIYDIFELNFDLNAELAS